MESFLQQLLQQRTDVFGEYQRESEAREALHNAAKERGAERLSAGEQKTYDAHSAKIAELTATLESLDERIAETRSEIERSGRSSPLVQLVLGGDGRSDWPGAQRQPSGRWVVSSAA